MKIPTRNIPGIRRGKSFRDKCRKFSSNQMGRKTITDNDYERKKEKK